jgi:hypothetical protein
MAQFETLPIFHRLNAKLEEYLHFEETCKCRVGSMRSVSVLALAVTAMSLGGCATGGSGSLDAAGLITDPSVCGLKCDILPKTKDPAPGGPITPVDSDGNPLPGADNGNGGNTADFKDGSDTIALESGIVVTSSGNPSKSKLTRNSATTTAKFEIETNSENNALWAKAKTMDEYQFGSNYVDPQLAAFGVTDPALGGTYKEYRSYIQDSKKPHDELLQVWTFDDSYVVQYRDETSGNEVADKQAWSFGTKAGGVQTKASAMPSSRATATYTGKFGSTAITQGWENTEDPRQEVNYNNSWRVRGSATGSVNFTTSRVSVTMTPEWWKTWADINGHKGEVLVNASDFTNVNNPGYLYGTGFMNAQIKASGVLTKTKTGNSLKGRTSLNNAQGWLSDGTTGLFFGSLYGADADELTGVFSASGTLPAPVGGGTPLANPLRGRVSHSGGLNLKKN